MDDPNITGSITEAMLIASLIKEHKTVLKPFNPSCRYDLAVEENGTFYRIQCKTGRLKNGVVVFPTANTVGKLSNSRRTYEGDVDYFGVYCPETKYVLSGSN